MGGINGADVHQGGSDPKDKVQPKEHGAVEGEVVIADSNLVCWRALISR
jgi:hypothetical protein